MSTENQSLGPSGTGWVASGAQFNGAVNTNLMSGSSRRGLKAKTLKRILKKAGLKVSGKKATLRARAKKAHLVRGGAPGLGGIQNGIDAAPVPGAPPVVVGGRRRSRRSRGLFWKLF